MATRNGAHWDMDAAGLLPGDVLRCGVSTNYVLIVKADREEDDILVTAAGAPADDETRCRLPAGERVQVSRRACFDGPMTAGERVEALHGWYAATSGYCIGRDAYWPPDLDRAWRSARDEAEAATASRNPGQSPTAHAVRAPRSGSPCTPAPYPDKHLNFAVPEVPFR